MQATTPFWFGTMTRSRPVNFADCWSFKICNTANLAFLKISLSKVSLLGLEFCSVCLAIFFIQLVEQSHICPVRRGTGADRNPEIHVLSMVRSLSDRRAVDSGRLQPAARSGVKNRIPDDVRARIVTLALDESELSPRELAVRFTDVERYLCRKPRFIACSRPSI